MNEYLEAIILGIIQGLTEFLPVSSSGHLELAKWLLGDSGNASESFLMTVVLHFGTALATVWVFRDYIWDILKKIGQPEGRKYILWIIISMIPAVFVGIGLDEQITALFDRQIILVSCMLLLTGIVLIISDHWKTSVQPLGTISALVIGIAQAIAILPGVSRSGATIATGVFLGIDRKSVAQFSFLMVIPLIFGKIAKDFAGGEIDMSSDKALPMLLGFAFSFFVGIAACQWMVKIVQNAKLRYFGYYCLVVGTLAILLRLFVLKG